MIGWPVIGLLDRLPWADHDVVPGVFSTEKSRVYFAMAAGPAARATRPESPWLDALNKKPYLSHTWAARRLTVAKTTPLSLYCPCLLRSLTIHACLRSPAASYVCSAYPAQRSHGPGGAGGVVWRALARLSSTLRTLASQPSLCGLLQTVGLRA